MERLQETTISTFRYAKDLQDMEKKRESQVTELLSVFNSIRTKVFDGLDTLDSQDPARIKEEKLRQQLETILVLCEEVLPG